MGSDYDRILKLARANLPKGTYNKLKSINDEEEFIAVAKYALISFLEREFYELERKISHLEAQEIDAFFAKNKLEVIFPKIMHFSITSNEEELARIQNLFSDVREEIRNV
ncbi:hypothetical protein COU60_00030 [Candidatus Pacearchaeota archaeon CG10_big_fil_rev_8_21_14_0_10_34_76]|nr:MAG: hypothetical protein COU60_00030 [Candidatus Pacearchaeota archaeon CG10_big_fil_rev_8_21_14_0_10_34_76]